MIWLNYHVADEECQEAQKYIKMVYDDPMTKHYGCGGEVVDGWLQKHIHTCEKCRKATYEANMP